MSTNFDRLREVFHVAVEQHSASQWDAYLDRACAEDVELRHNAALLLKAHAEGGSLMDQPMPENHRTGLYQPTAEAPGTVIGPYKLMEQIGEGGMGLVFVAEQQQPVRRKVALKVIKPGMDSRQVIARFEAERQALALMDHPNIAKVHDGGTTEMGRPYFVMELVKGVPITSYCDGQRLPTRQRLELFLSVCHAVQHAHQKGVIHRDLKPSNVLVAVHDVTPVVKVIDFGIAKPTGPRLIDKTVYTGFAQLIGTPLYMSPEQAGRSSLDVDTRSDIYSLGVLLYELLTGTTPFDSETLRQVDYDEMRRIILEDEPPKPSTRLSTLARAALSTVAEHHGVEPRKLSQQVRGELDWIVMKALEKDRNRRYESASAFAKDVQRYLKDEPVEACPPSAGYRLRKYARRNRRVLVTAGIVAVALVTATAVSTWQAVRALNAQHQAEADRDRAEVAEHQAKTDQDRAREAERRAATEAAVATAINNFLLRDLLRQVRIGQQEAAGYAPNPNLTMREALDRAAAKVGERFQDQPLVEAAMRTVIGDAYRGVGEFGLGVSHWERAVALRKAHLRPDDPETLHGRHSLAAAYTDAGRHHEALALYAEVLELFKATFGPEHLITSGCLHGCARANQKAGKLDEAERLLRAALEIQRKHDDPGSREATADSLGWLSRNLLMQQKYTAAEAAAREVLAIFEKDVPERWKPFVAMSLLGGALLGQQKYSAAEPLLLQGYEGLKVHAATRSEPWKWRLTEAVQRIVSFYEVTNQPEKASEWREKLRAEKATTESWP